MVAGVTITTTSIIVNSTALFRQPTGQVAIWCQRRARDLETQAKEYAPPRRSFARHGTVATGAMQASIHGGVSQHDTHSLNIMVWTTSPHAQYVLSGTGSNGRNFIYTTLGYANRKLVNQWASGGLEPSPFTSHQKGFVMPVSGRLLYKVRGQKANPFITDAYFSVQNRHRSLPKLTFKRYGFDNF